MASFQAKIGWKIPFRSNKTRNRKFIKKLQKNSKNQKKAVMASFQAQIG